MFSILIPSFNNEKYLEFSINSILKTSKLPNEIYVHVNQDKNGKTRELLNRYKIKYTFSEENLGLCTSINIIAKKAKFDYLLYAHDDMYFCPEWENALTHEIKEMSHKMF